MKLLEEQQTLPFEMFMLPACILTAQTWQAALTAGKLEERCLREHGQTLNAWSQVGRQLTLASLRTENLHWLLQGPSPWQDFSIVRGYLAMQHWSRPLAHVYAFHQLSIYANLSYQHIVHCLLCLGNSSAWPETSMLEDYHYLSSYEQVIMYLLFTLGVSSL